MLIVVAATATVVVPALWLDQRGFVISSPWTPISVGVFVFLQQRFPATFANAFGHCVNFISWYLHYVRVVPIRLFTAAVVPLQTPILWCFSPAAASAVPQWPSQAELDASIASPVFDLRVSREWLATLGLAVVLGTMLWSSRSTIRVRVPIDPCDVIYSARRRSMHQRRSPKTSTNDELCREVTDDGLLQLPRPASSSTEEAGDHESQLEARVWQWLLSPSGSFSEKFGCEKVIGECGQSCTVESPSDWAPPFPRPGASRFQKLNRWLRHHSRTSTWPLPLLFENVTLFGLYAALRLHDVSLVNTTSIVVGVALFSRTVAFAATRLRHRVADGDTITDHALLL
jgi:hypothetical protein